VPRPRVHGLDSVLDVAERIATDAGTVGVTLRRLATDAGVSNGSIYHAFSSKEELLARVWARAARRLLSLQEARVEAALSSLDRGQASAVEAVVVTAVAPVEFAIEHPASARWFFMQRREDLVTPSLPVGVADEIVAIQASFTHLLIRLAQARWSRRDRVAVEAIAVCVVDLPGGLLYRRMHDAVPVDGRPRAEIEAACRAILALKLPPAPREKAPSPTPSPRSPK
jgi:AcrR family transcriptional regulator